MSVHKSDYHGFKKKIALEKEVVLVLETYGMRLLALKKTLDDSADAPVMSDHLEEIRLENESALRRLEKTLCVAARSAVLDSDVLGLVWNITRMKALYHPVLKGALATTDVCATWRNRPEILEAMERRNQEIFGCAKEDVRNYISIFSYPGLVKDHLFNVRNILEKYAKTTHCSAYLRFVDLLSWLDRKQPTLTSVKGLGSAKLLENLSTSNEVVLQKGRMKMPICDSGDASNAELILSESVVIVRTLPRRMFRKEKIELSPTPCVDVEEGDDECSFHLLGVGLRKVLKANSASARNEWLRSFSEIKRSGTRVTG